MSGPKRNPDSLNTIGVVVVGICGAVMVYVSITALQAFYMNDTSELQTMADYGGQDTTAKSLKAEEISNITEPKMGTPSITIDKAMELIVRDADAAQKAKQPANHLVPGACESNHPTEKAQPGRPVLDPTLMGGCKGDGKAPPTPPTPTPASGSGSGSGSGSAVTPGSGSGSAADKKNPKNPKLPAGAAAGDNVPGHLHATGSPADTHNVSGGGGAPTTGNSSGSAVLAPGGHAP
jgi:hypothetical protein